MVRRDDSLQDRDGRHRLPTTVTGISLDWDVPVLIRKDIDPSTVPSSHLFSDLG